MLKEKQVFLMRRQRFLDNLNRNGAFRTEDGRRLTAVVVTYPSQTGNSSRLASGAVFTLDPELSNELAKDPPPPYFSAANVPPPKYEDAVQLDAASLPGSSGNQIDGNSSSHLSISNVDESLNVQSTSQNETSVPSSSSSSTSITDIQSNLVSSNIENIQTSPSSSSSTLSSTSNHKNDDNSSESRNPKV